VKDVAGYSLKDLFIGSEGTLGVITEVLLSFSRAEARKTLLATFSSMQAAAEAISAAIIAARIIPLHLGVHRSGQPCSASRTTAKSACPPTLPQFLSSKLDGHPPPRSPTRRPALDAIVRRHGATDVQVAADEAEGAKLAMARRQAFRPGPGSP